MCKDDNLTCVLHKNAAANHLKLQDYDDVIKHCDAGEFSASDILKCQLPK